MSYIAPNTKVILCRGVPLDSGYNHTFWFANETEQYNKISSYAKFTDWQDTSYTYQRANSGSLKVKHKADDLYDINYLMFQNTSFGNKWFYAFVTSVDYDNDVTTTVNYQIDVMQTWYFDYRLGNCFVERAHSSTDVIGDNIVDEGIGVPYYTNEYSQDYVPTKDDTNKTPAMSLCIYYVPKFKSSGGVSTGDKYEGATWITLEETVSGTTVKKLVDVQISELDDDKIGRIQVYNGVISPCAVFVVPIYLEDTVITPTTTYTKTKTLNWIAKAFRLMEENNLTVYACTQMPYKFCQNQIIDNQGNMVYTEIPETPDSIVIAETINFKDYPTDTPYTPKNNKLFTYPYKMLNVYNNSGEMHQYHWEDFYTRSGHNFPMANFDLVRTPYMLTKLTCVPKYYKGQASMFAESVLFDAYPQPPISIDSFNTWWAQNKATLGLSAVSTALNIAGLMTMGAPAGTVAQNIAKQQAIFGVPKQAAKTTNVQGLSQIAQVNAYTNVASLLGNIVSAENRPNTVSGNGMTDNVLVQMGKCGFTLYCTSCKKEYAKMIDTYFTMFGYAQKRNEVPTISNIHKTRQNWNYIKCATAIIHSVTSSTGTVLKSLPADAEEEITSIYERGITFWDKTLEPGEYGDGTNPISVV